MVFGVGLQIVDINVGQARNKQFQFLLVENADQSLGDDVVKSFEERVELLPNCTRHFHLTDKPNVLHLVLLGYDDVASIGFEVASFGHSKFLNLGRKSQVVAELGDLVLDEESQTLQDKVGIAIKEGTSRSLQLST